MTQIGPSDAGLFNEPLPDLLRAVSGVAPESSGEHVRLDLAARTARPHSIQRLALAKQRRRVVVGIWPAELKDQAQRLYAGGRGEALLVAARKSRWKITAAPHLAFRFASPMQRLYMDNEDIDVDEYVRRWSGADARRIGAHTADEVRRSIWPWLKECGYATARDNDKLKEFLRILGNNRQAHLRPALRLIQTWPAERLTVPSQRRDLVTRRSGRQ
jgi:hypothetical protein